jgi:hypothetical protein
LGGAREGAFLPAGYLAPSQTIYYMVMESSWGAATRAKSGEETAWILALSEFRTRASEGHLRIYGYSSATHKHELIDKTHWMSFGLNHLAAFGDDDTASTVPASAESGFDSVRGDATTYSSLHIEAHDVYITWPRSKLG